MTREPLDYMPLAFIAVIIVVAAAMYGSYFITSAKRDTQNCQPVPSAPRGDGDIVFRTGDVDMIRLSSDGIIYINGKPTDKDKEVTKTLRWWLAQASHVTPSDSSITLMGGKSCVTCATCDCPSLNLGGR